MLELDFHIIKDPKGWNKNLRLRGDWLFIKVSDGKNWGYGEASHSGNDSMCINIIRRMFKKYVSDLKLSLNNIKKLETHAFSKVQDFLYATAISGINQALYELLAKQNAIPVWKLFADTPVREKVKLYITINRSLKTREEAEYLNIVSKLKKQGFSIYKCAPFERVKSSINVFKNSRPGFAVLQVLKKAFPELSFRIDFHSRFTPKSFFELLPEIHELKPNWIEEPFKFSNSYRELKNKTSIPIAGGELYFGTEFYRKLIQKKWVDVIMPDVKHVGGFGPLLDVCKVAGYSAEVSPHNPSGPVSTAASLHCAALCKNVTSLEYPFDENLSRRKYGNLIENGFMLLNSKPGWGVELDRV